jgi:hypothetical protein
LEDDYGDEDDINDYGADQYYAEDSDEDDSGDHRQYMHHQNYPPGAMF